MKQTEVLKFIQNWTKSKAITNHDKVAPETLLGNKGNEALGLDSLDILELTYDLEKVTNKIWNGEDPELFSVYDVMKYFGE